MRNILFIGLVLVGLGVVGGAFLLSDTGRGLGGNETEPTAMSSIDGKQPYTLEVDGMAREFIVYRPASLDENVETPVVFMFHGSGGTGQKFYEISGWKEKADEEGITVVFPTAMKYHVFNDEKVVQGEVKYDVAVYQTKWNDFGLGSILDPEYPDQTLADDVTFTREMVDFLKANYPVDESRFYATGFSNGASFTARLVIEMSDVFAAFAPSGAGRHSATAAAEYMPEDHTPRPVAVMLGEVDPKLTHAAGLEAFPMDEAAANEGEFMSEYVIDPYLELIGLEDELDYERTGRLAIYTYDKPLDENAETQFVMVIVENMKHIYPNGTNSPVVATDLFWTFFEQYSL